MKVCVFGAGYVGLVTAACLSEMGNSVVCRGVDHAPVTKPDVCRAQALPRIGRALMPLAT